MDLNKLKKMQQWPLEQKVAHTIDTVSVFIYSLAEIGMTPYISFSGGKDSTTLLDIIRRFIDKEHKIPVVFCNTGNEWPEVVKFVRSIPDVKIIRPKLTVKEVIEKYGFPLISKEQAGYIREVRNTTRESVYNRRLIGDPKCKCGIISHRWRFLLDSQFAVSDRCCDYLKKLPFRKYERDTCSAPILGTMAEESNRRQGQYLRRGGCNILTAGHPASHPLSIWTDYDIWEYKRKFNIEFSSIYNNPNIKQTGCMMCGFGATRKADCRFEILYDNYPKAYNQFLNYTNNSITYREALRLIGVSLPDEIRQLDIFKNNKL